MTAITSSVVPRRQVGERGQGAGWPVGGCSGLPSCLPSPLLPWQSPKCVPVSVLRPGVQGLRPLSAELSAMPLSSSLCSTSGCKRREQCTLAREILVSCSWGVGWVPAASGVAESRCASVCSEAGPRPTLWSGQDARECLTDLVVAQSAGQTPEGRPCGPRPALTPPSGTPGRAWKGWGAGGPHGQLATILHQCPQQRAGLVSP